MKTIPSSILEHFEIRPKTILSNGEFFNGWYLISILFSLTSFQHFDYFRQNGIFFESHYMIQPGWYRMYLTSNQARFLYQEQNNISFYSIIKEKSILTTSENYLVYASSDFIPPTKFHKIDENLFVVSDISQIRNDPRVLKIKPHLPPELENRYANGFSQSGEEIPTYDNINNFLISRPFYSHGITGKGQIISVSDSGLDPYHCSFYDPNVSAPYSTPNFNHRKIVLYDPVADDKEGEHAHGTHVCGIIAGKALCQNCGLDLYNGIAPDAKIYMHDLGELSKGSSDIIDVDLPYFIKRARLVSSYIFSNSWGYPRGEEEIRATFSRYAYLNPDLTFVFACGNSHSSYTIHTPSNSKNVLAVGALAAPFGSHYETASNGMFESNSHKLLLDHLIGPTIANAMKQSPSASYNKKQVHVIDSFDVPNINSIVIISNTLIEKTPNICSAVISKASHASLVIFASRVLCNNSNKIPQPTIPFLCFNKTIDNSLLHSFKTATVYPYYTGSRETIKRLPLSSQGPSDLGYTKPEIVATGQLVLSPSSGPYYDKTPRACDSSKLTTKSGTSMAAPNAAGILILVRQFFTEGWYPSLKNPNNSTLDNKLNVPFIPTSTLLRGFAVNSAKQIDKPIATGFGLMSPYEGLGFTGIGLRIAHNRTIKSGEHHKYKIEVHESKHPLSITLNYLDPPLSSLSYMPLFADLDLVVVSPSGEVFKGNEFEDQFQTTEKIIINKAAKGTYYIHVLASRYPQPYASPLYSIVINGKFRQTDFQSNQAFLIEEITENCYGKCSNGNCKNGQCICNKGYYGHLCDQKANDKIMTNSYINLKHKLVKHYQFLVTDDNNVSLRLETKSNKFAVCFNFKNDVLKIVDANQNNCYFSKQNALTFSFNSSNSILKNGDNFIMSIYAITATDVSIVLSVGGVKASFSIIYWFTHLPIWKMILVSASVGIVFLVIFTLILVYCTFYAGKKKKKTKDRLLENSEEYPNPAAIQQDPSDILKIEEAI